MSDLNTLARRVHATATEKGWHDTSRALPESIALMHSELSEALEAWRDPQSGDMTMWFGLNPDKPEGWAVELIDCLIRIFDTLWDEGVNVDAVFEAKAKYNESRPYRHGGKRA